MASQDYHFITQWRVNGTMQEIFNILADARTLTEWWPAVYLDVKILKESDPQTNTGAVIDLYTKGWLPYTLRWNFTVTALTEPETITLQADGDFVGRGIWTFRQDGESVDITYDWEIRAAKPLLRRLSFAMKPIFSANHRWAMEMGLKSLELELARRRATNEAERAQIAAPPLATSSSTWPLLASLLTPIVVGYLLYRLIKKPKKP